MRDYEKLRRQDALDMLSLSYKISGPLHHCTKTQQCSSPPDCDMCYNAARLSVQSYRPMVEKRVVEHLVHEYNAGCTMPHPGGD